MCWRQRDGRGQLGTHVLLLPKGSHGDSRCAALHTHTRAHTRARMCTHAHAHTCMHTHMHTCVHTHTQNRQRSHVVMHMDLGLRSMMTIFSQGYVASVPTPLVLERETKSSAPWSPLELPGWAVRPAAPLSFISLFGFLVSKPTPPVLLETHPRERSLALGDHIKEVALNMFRLNGATQQSKGPAHSGPPNSPPHPSSPNPCHSRMHQDHACAAEIRTCPCFSEQGPHQPRHHHGPWLLP